jgi:hypothetical protein
MRNACVRPNVQVAGLRKRGGLSSLAAIGLAVSILAVPSTASAAISPLPDVSPTGIASSPDLATTNGGTAIAVWLQEIDGKSIVMAATRAPQGAFAAPFQLSTAGVDASAPQIATSPFGGALIVWREGGDDTAVIRTATRTSDGQFQPAKTLSQPGADIYTFQPPSVAFDRLGRAAVAWAQGNSIQLSLSDLSGEPGPAETVSGPVGGHNFSPKVAFDATGAAVVVWTKDGSRVRTVTQPRNGARGSITDLSAPGGRPTNPSLAVDRDGNMIASWQQFSDDIASSDGTIHHASRPNDGTFASSQSQPDFPSGSDQSELPIVFDSTGRAVSVWEGFESLSTSTRPVGGIFSDPKPFGLGNDVDPDLAVSGSNDVFAVWAGSPNATDSKRVLRGALERDGVFGPPLTLSDADYAVSPAVAFTPIDAVVVWVDDDRIRAAAGTPEYSNSTADTTEPTITVSKPTEGQHFAIGEAVTPDFSCDDSGSGIASCEALNAVDTATAGTRTFSVRAVDSVGNSQTADVSYIVDPAPAGTAPSGPAGASPAPPASGGNPTTVPPAGAPPSSTPPATPTTPAAPAAAAAKVLISRATALKGRRITLLVTPSAPGKLVVSGTTGAGKKRVKVLSGTATVKSAKALKVTLKPTSKGKKALRPGRTVKIALTVSLKDATGKTTSSTKSVRVKIKR